MSTQNWGDTDLERFSDILPVNFWCDYWEKWNERTNTHKQLFSPLLVSYIHSWQWPSSPHEKGSAAGQDVMIVPLLPACPSLLVFHCPSASLSLHPTGVPMASVPQEYLLRYTVPSSNSVFAVPHSSYSCSKASAITCLAFSTKSSKYPYEIELKRRNSDYPLSELPEMKV